jgi:hypothetical protein
VKGPRLDSTTAGADFEKYVFSVFASVSTYPMHFMGE